LTLQKTWVFLFCSVVLPPYPLVQVNQLCFKGLISPLRTAEGPHFILARPQVPTTVPGSCFNLGFFAFSLLINRSPPTFESLLPRQPPPFQVFRDGRNALSGRFQVKQPVDLPFVSRIGYHPRPLILPFESFFLAAFLFCLKRLCFPLAFSAKVSDVMPLLNPLQTRSDPFFFKPPFPSSRQLSGNAFHFFFFPLDCI